MNEIWTDPQFGVSMREQEPGDRARFLAHVYETSKEEFKNVTPDEILVNEFGRGTYVRLANEKLVPIAVVPAGIMLA